MQSLLARDMVAGDAGGWRAKDRNIRRDTAEAHKRRRGEMGVTDGWWTGGFGRGDGEQAKAVFGGGGGVKAVASRGKWGFGDKTLAGEHRQFYSEFSAFWWQFVTLSMPLGLDSRQLSYFMSSLLLVRPRSCRITSGPGAGEASQKTANSTVTRHPRPLIWFHPMHRLPCCWRQ